MGNYRGDEWRSSTTRSGATPHRDSALGDGRGFYIGGSAASYERKPAIERLVRGTFGDEGYGLRSVKRNLTAKFSEDEHIRLDAAASVLGLGRSEMLREILRAGLDDLEAALPVEGTAALQQAKQEAAQQMRRDAMKENEGGREASQRESASDSVPLGSSLRDGSPVLYDPRPATSTSGLLVAGEDTDDNAGIYALLAIRIAMARGGGVLVDTSGAVAARAREEIAEEHLEVLSPSPGDAGSLPVMGIYGEGEDRAEETLIRGVLTRILEIGDNAVGVEGRRSNILRYGIRNFSKYPKNRRSFAHLKEHFTLMSREFDSSQEDRNEAAQIALSLEYHAASPVASVILGDKGGQSILEGAVSREASRFIVIDLSAFDYRAGIRRENLSEEEMAVSAGVLPVAAAAALRLSTSSNEPDTAGLYGADAMLASTPDIRHLLESYLRECRSRDTTPLIGIRGSVPPETLALIPNRLVGNYEVGGADEGLGLLGIEPSPGRREQLARLLPYEALFRAEDGKVEALRVE